MKPRRLLLLAILLLMAGVTFAQRQARTEVFEYGGVAFTHKYHLNPNGVGLDGPSTVKHSGSSKKNLGREYGWVTYTARHDSRLNYQDGNMHGVVSLNSGITADAPRIGLTTKSSFTFNGKFIDGVPDGVFTIKYSFVTSAGGQTETEKESYTATFRNGQFVDKIICNGEVIKLDIEGYRHGDEDIHGVHTKWIPSDALEALRASETDGKLDTKKLFELGYIVETVRDDQMGRNSFCYVFRPGYWFGSYYRSNTGMMFFYGDCTVPYIPYRTISPINVAKQDLLQRIEKEYKPGRAEALKALQLDSTYQAQYVTIDGSRYYFTGEVSAEEYTQFLDALEAKTLQQIREQEAEYKQQAHDQALLSDTYRYEILSNASSPDIRLKRYVVQDGSIKVESVDDDPQNHRYICKVSGRLVLPDGELIEPEENAYTQRRYYSFEREFAISYKHSEIADYPKNRLTPMDNIVIVEDEYDTIDGLYWEFVDILADYDLLEEEQADNEPVLAQMSTFANYVSNNLGVLNVDHDDLAGTIARLEEVVLQGNLFLEYIEKYIKILENDALLSETPGLEGYSEVMDAASLDWSEDVDMATLDRVLSLQEEYMGSIEM